MPLREPEDPSFGQNVIKYIYPLLVVLGVGIGVWWGSSYGVWPWQDTGLYAIVMLLCGFGTVGTLLYWRKHDDDMDIA